MKSKPPPKKSLAQQGSTVKIFDPHDAVASQLRALSGRIKKDPALSATVDDILLDACRRNPKDESFVDVLWRNRVRFG